MSTSNNNSGGGSCQIVLSLAHLLQQHSLSYDNEKNALLNASVNCATKLANTSESEVHVILTGSPRPTFAETNAWLLEGTAQSSSSSASPKRKVSNSEMMDSNNDNDDNRPAHLKGSYSIADNVHYSSSNMDIDDETNNDEEDDTEMQDDNNNSSSTVLQEYINEFTNNSSTPNANMNDLASSPGVKTGESVLRDFQARKLSEADMSGSSSNTTPVHNNSFVRRNTTGVTFKDNNDESNNKNSRRRSTFDSQSNNNNSGPMVGQAVVNAISQSSGVGLQSSRSKLLQGTIDRPLWSQTRWTDGECLFSELVDLCGLESFENSGAAGSHNDQGSSGPDAAAGGAGSKLQKTTNLSANLITVPATTLHEPDAGVSPTTIEEIARGIIRTLKRKSSPPASNVYIVLPPDFSSEGSKRELLVTLLKQSYEKLEQYNHMIGQPVLMGGAELKFVNIE